MKIFHIIIVGTGGTGGALATQLGRFAASTKDSIIHLSLVDGDVVEEKNVARQPFSTYDIALPKCVSLAEGISECFGFERVKAYPRYVLTTRDIPSLYGVHNPITIVVGCVDNHHARGILHNYFEDSKNIVYIDSANEYSNGEIVWGIKANGKVVSPDRVFYYPEVLNDTKSVVEMSCSELNNVDPQHYAVNLMAATLVFGAIARFVSTGQFPTGITYFDVFDNMVVNRPISEWGEVYAENV